MQLFVECGWAAWLVLLLTLAALTLSIVALVLGIVRARAARLVSVLAVAAALLPAGTGALGTFWGRHQVDYALAGAHPDQRETIREQGYAEAAQCTKLGMGGAVAPLALAVAALLVVVLRRPEQP